MIKEAIKELMKGENLSKEMMREVMLEIMEGNGSEAQIGSVLTALHLKGETVDEITACAEVMREKCSGIEPAGDVLEIVGTGGDEAFTFNISTVSAFCIAGAGVKVAKHGNRSVSSKSGSADVLEALGAVLDIEKEQSEQVLEKSNMCFLFAQKYHTSMKYVATARRDLGVRTIFNIIGPLSNPASAKFQVLGVYSKSLLMPMAKVLKNLGVKRAMVVCGDDGLDEVTLTGETAVVELKDGTLSSYKISPEELGFTLCEPADLVGGDPSENAIITKDILSGKIKGAKRDIVVLNSAVGLYVASGNLTLAECVKRITAVIDSGEALKTLDNFVKLTNE